MYRVIQPNSASDRDTPSPRPPSTMPSLAGSAPACFEPFSCCIVRGDADADADSDGWVKDVCTTAKQRVRLASLVRSSPRWSGSYILSTAIITVSLTCSASPSSTLGRGSPLPNHRIHLSSNSISARKGPRHLNESTTKQTKWGKILIFRRDFHGLYHSVPKICGMNVNRLKTIKIRKNPD